MSTYLLGWNSYNYTLCHWEQGNYLGSELRTEALQTIIFRNLLLLLLVLGKKKTVPYKSPRTHEYDFLHTCTLLVETPLTQSVSTKRQCHTSQYLRNRKHVPCFYWDIETRVKVWENEKNCENTSRRRVFP